MHFEEIKDGIRVFSPAKLNLYLEVGPLLPNRFHEIDSIFQSITLYDVIETRHAPDGVLELEGDLLGDPVDNLVHKAAMKLLASEWIPERRRPGARIRLEKRIPVGAGLGGGSGDAASALRALSWLWSLGLKREDLMSIAASLGSDVPFFLVGGTARCRGRGEVIDDWNDVFDGRPALHFVLVYPDVHVSTPKAYQLLDASRGTDACPALTLPSPLDSMPPASVRDALGCGNLFFNRFESVIFPELPKLRQVHALMSQEPFLKVLMSGSGSTIYGVSASASDAERTAIRLGERLRGEARVFVARSERPFLDSPLRFPRSLEPGDRKGGQ